jgi:protein-S-isoprenylcysteine O-methyltransferase Ste14
MKALDVVFAVVWAAFWAYWLVSAFSTKKGHASWRRELGSRALIAAAVVPLLRIGAFGHDTANGDLWLAGVGLALFALGLGFAVWARVNIGRNWGAPMSRKEEPELVTTGPYRLVRHPIYSGILLGGIGTAVALGWAWMLPVGIAALYFVYSATVEEKYLAGEFPDSYPAYKRSTKMLVPFVF